MVFLIIYWPVDLSDYFKREDEKRRRNSYADQPGKFRPNRKVSCQAGFPEKRTDNVITLCNQ